MRRIMKATMLISSATLCEKKTPSPPAKTKNGKNSTLSVPMTEVLANTMLLLLRAINIPLNKMKTHDADVDRMKMVAFIGVIIATNFGDQNLMNATKMKDKVTEMRMDNRKDAETNSFLLLWLMDGMNLMNV